LAAWESRTRNGRKAGQSAGKGMGLGTGKGPLEVRLRALLFRMKLA